MAELMLGGELGDVSGLVPRGIPGEEGGILHSADFGAGLGVDDGDDLVGVGAVALIELREGLLDDVEVAGTGLGMGGECEDVDFDGAERGEIGSVGGGEVGAGSPGEVADVFAVEVECLCVVGVDRLAGRNAARSDGVTAREGEGDIECCEVREELCSGVVLVAVPGSVPEDAGLGIPLAAHNEVAFVTVASDGEGELVVEGEVEGDRVVGCERMWESELGYGVVEGVAVIGCDEVHRRGEVAVAVGVDVGDGDAA